MCRYQRPNQWAQTKRHLVLPKGFTMRIVEFGAQLADLQ